MLCSIQRRECHPLECQQYFPDWWFWLSFFLCSAVHKNKHKPSITLIMVKMEKSDYQWMASAILTMILGRENLADLVGRLWATCGGQYVDESQPNHPGAAGAAENRQRAPDGPPRKIATGRISNRKQVCTPVLRWPLRSTQNWEHHLLV